MPSPRTITGTLALVPAPPTTQPALPAVVFAVQVSGGEAYIIARGDSGFYTPDTWEEAALQPGDAVVAGGTVAARQDRAGKNFQTLKLSRITPAQGQ